MSNIAWICTDAAGNVNHATLVGFMDPTDLKRLRAEGRNPRLINFGDLPITIGSPVPETAQILD